MFLLVEYGGKWKMLHYYATHFYNRTLISPYIDGNTLKVNLVHETPASERMTAHKSQESIRWHSLGQNAVPDYSAGGQTVDKSGVVSMERAGGAASWTVQVTLQTWACHQPLKTWTTSIQQVGLSSQKPSAAGLAKHWLGAETGLSGASFLLDKP